MTRIKLTVSLPDEIVDYLRSTPNMSATIAEAVAEYRAHELEHELETAYRQDAAEAESLNAEWEAADAGTDADGLESKR